MVVPIVNSHESVQSNSRSSTVVSSEKVTPATGPPQTRSTTVLPDSEVRKPPPQLPPSEGTTTSASFGSDESRYLDDFTFSDLQGAQYIEEKLEEIIMVLTFNDKTLKDLRDLYQSLDRRLARSIRDANEDIQIFASQIIAVEKDMDRQVMRARTLLKKLQERKALLNSILQYRSMKASEFFANKAQESSDSMEKLTEKMHTIAEETIKETVSMRIITVVTLVFLPGTFVATFLSTDVLRWNDDNHRQFSLGALSTYLAISLPLMIITLSTWYFMSHSAARYHSRSLFHKFLEHYLRSRTPKEENPVYVV